MAYVLARPDLTYLGLWSMTFVGSGSKEPPLAFPSEGEAEARATWLGLDPETVQPLDVQITIALEEEVTKPEPEPTPKPEPEPVLEPVGTFWLCDGQTGERITVVGNDATLPQPPSKTFTIEFEVETSGKVQLGGAGESRTEGQAPYILHGDTNGVPLNSSLAEGEYEIFAIYEDKELRRRFRF